MKRRTLTILTLFLAVTFVARPRFGTAVISVGYTPEKTCFTVTYRGETSTYKVTPLFVLPGEDVKVEIHSDDKEASFAVAEWTPSGRNSWNWKAPKKAGFYPTTVVEIKTGESMDLNVFVMVPYGKMQSDRINGYQIGKYPKVAGDKKVAYSIPRGFIEVTPENRNTLVSPHFKLGQFLCKQRGKYPKYVVLRERLILKLEYLLEHVNADGIPARTFSVMSGYRTPYYNKQLKNVKLSRHMWGDAADIYINNDPTVDAMDDLNGDGKRDAKDAELLYELVDELQDKPAFKQFVGGLGWYKPTSSHGPFIHVDARGTQAHWNSSSN